MNDEFPLSTGTLMTWVFGNNVFRCEAFEILHDDNLCENTRPRTYIILIAGFGGTDLI